MFHNDDEDLKKSGGLTSYLQSIYKTFLINRTCHVVALAEIDQRQSKPVMQSFYHTPADKSITIISKVHPMYTGGGPDALIDSIQGTTTGKRESGRVITTRILKRLLTLKK